MDTSAAALTKQGIARQRAGDSAGATRLFAQAIETDPTYDMAWLWLSSCLSTPAEKRYCLDQALLANPDSMPAQKGLARLGSVGAIRPAALGGEVPIALPPELMDVLAKPKKKDLPLWAIIAIVAAILIPVLLVNSLSSRPAPSSAPRAAIGKGVIAGYDEVTRNAHVSDITLFVEPAGTPGVMHEVGTAHEGDRVDILEARDGGDTLLVRTASGLTGWTQIDFVKRQ